MPKSTNYEIKTTLAVDGEKEFKAAMDAANKSMRVSDSEMKKLEAAYNAGGEIMDYYTGRARVLNREAEQQEAIVEAQKENALPEEVAALEDDAPARRRRNRRPKSGEKAAEQEPRAEKKPEKKQEKTEKKAQPEKKPEKKPENKKPAPKAEKKPQAPKNPVQNAPKEPKAEGEAPKKRRYNYHRRRKPSKAPENNG